MSYDVIIIGEGPAGISAAIYSARAGAKTLVLGSGTSAAEKAKVVENYYGTDGVVSGALLQAHGIEQLLRLGVEHIQSEVTDISPDEDGGFSVSSAQEKYSATAVIITTGKQRVSSGLDGTDRLEGRGISHCAICDGFFFRNKKLGVLGNGDYAAHEASQLTAFSDSVTIFTNGRRFEGKNAPCPVDESKLLRVYGEKKLEGLELDDSSTIELDGLFIAQGVAGADDFAKKLGLRTDGGNIVVDKNAMTSCAGVFAAGDCIGGLNQISTAVGEGALAGQRAAELVRAKAKNK